MCEHLSTWGAIVEAEANLWTTGRLFGRKRARLEAIRNVGCRALYEYDMLIKAKGGIATFIRRLQPLSSGERRTTSRYQASAEIEPPLQTNYLTYLGLIDACVSTESMMEQTVNTTGQFCME